MAKEDRNHKITNSALIKRGFEFDPKPYNTWIRLYFGYHCRWRYEYKDFKCMDWFHGGITFEWENINTLEKLDRSLYIIMKSI